MIIFFGYGLFSLGAELKRTFHTFHTLYGLQENETRALLLGDVYLFAAQCNSIIPEGSTVLFFTNEQSNKLSADLFIMSADLFINYFMYPRRLFILNNHSPYPEVPPTLKELDLKEISQKGIEWIVLRYPANYGLNRVVKVKNGKAAATYDLDAGRGNNL